jgi:NAD(P)-dependent dehydrogenase (short-subunit alcohol dehydrogenase family)
MVSYCIDTFGRIDTMICNAGIDSIKPATTLTESEWDKILTVNLRGAYYCARYAAVEMANKKVAMSL